MPMPFKPSPHPTLGVELELQLIDPVTYGLVSKSPELLAEAKRRGYSWMKAEIQQSILELETTICSNLDDCRKELIERLQLTMQLVSEYGLIVSITGTHPFQPWQQNQVHPNERYRNLQEKFRWLTRRTNIYGLHVHVGVSSGDKAISICNAMTRYLPHLLALSANSPYWGGEDTGLMSCRVGMIEAYLYSGLPHYCTSWSDFENYTDTLLKTKTISSMKDLYWHIRPNPTYGTVECRICDGISRLDDTLALVALIQSLVVWLDHQLTKDPEEVVMQKEEYWVAPENQWRAARDGMDAAIISKGENESPLKGQIVKLIERLDATSQHLGNSSYLHANEKILSRGSGAYRQRAIFARTHSLPAVVKEVAKEFSDSIAGHHVVNIR